ncbi:hypothetical protein ACFRAR_34755 [Kitasatospora sp. NPDC056651]|uniref:hypothetical protein n=1 Tax=Kitasatospora sp. NPDC056651 TaxID=3345892 RepID=UPI0036AE7D7C
MRLNGEPADIYRDAGCGEPADDDPRFDEVLVPPLPHSGWAMRPGRGANGRPAVEVYDGEDCVDVLVASGLVRNPLRGARNGGSGKRFWTVAWGRLPNGIEHVYLEFRRRRLVRIISPVIVAGRFWICEVPGSYSSVAAFADGVHLDSLTVG